MNPLEYLAVWRSASAMGHGGNFSDCPSMTSPEFTGEQCKKLYITFELSDFIDYATINHNGDFLYHKFISHGPLM